MRFLSLVAVVLFSLLALTACGGSTHKLVSPKPVTPPYSQPVKGHPCDPAASSFYMQCALQPLTQLNRAPVKGVVAHGIDFAWSCPSPAGWDFGVSYLSPDASKNWSRGCVNLWHGAGKKTVPVWESSANRTQQGFNAGFQDAFSARGQFRALGGANNRPINYAVDCDCSLGSIVGYFQGADAGTASILHISHAAAVQLVAVYGGYNQVGGLFRSGVVGHTNWQTYAWSNGAWQPASIAPLEQYLNSNAVDYDRALAVDYGQWPLATPKPPDPYRVYPQVRFALPHHVKASEYNTVKTWDRAKCKNPVKRAICKSTHFHLVLLRDRIDYVAHHPLHRGKATYNLFNRGIRRAGINKRLT